MTPRENWIQVRRLVLSFVAVMDKYYDLQDKVIPSEIAGATLTPTIEAVQNIDTT